MNQLFKNGQRRTVAEIHDSMPQFAPASIRKESASPIEPWPMNLMIDSPQAQLDDPVTDPVQLLLNELRSRIGIEQRERDLSVQNAVGAS